MPRSAGQRVATSPAAWQAIWGDTLGAVRVGSADQHVLEAWWDAALSALPPITRSLEIGAGAMPLPSTRLARLRPDTEIVASDFRECSVAGEDSRLIRIADAAIEALPFADAAFDLLLSQFAIEYAEPEAAAREIRRVLRPGGIVLLAIHHGEGFFAAYLRHRMAFLEIGAEVAAAIGAKALAREVRRARLRRAVRKIDTLLATYLARPEYRDVAEDLADLRAIAESAAAGRSFDASQQLILSQVDPALALARAQSSAGLTSDAIAGLAARLEEAGFEAVRIEPIASATHHLAWGVHAIARQSA